MTDRSLAGKIWHTVVETNQAKSIAQALWKERLSQHCPGAKNFLDPIPSNLLSPWLLRDMKKAVDRIIQALEKQERIVIYGDFDTDGISSTVLLVHGLQQLGGQVSYRIPDREKESHGLKKQLIEPLIKKNVSLLITCDCGINDDAEVAFAAQNQIDVIVTDHHEARAENFPKAAIAVINPQVSPDFPEKYLSGSAVALLLLKAVAEVFLKQPREDLSVENFLAPYYEIAALGVVADCVPLVGQNRLIAQLGIAQMKQTQWSGLQTLFDFTNTLPESIDEQTIGFAIAPRLNAASRIGNVLQAVQLFLGEESLHVKRFAYLEKLNNERKILTHTSVIDSAQQINPQDRYQLLFDETWKPGVLGLVASRCAEKLGHPVIACTEYNTTQWACSCRAPQNYSMIEALHAGKELFEVFGGHAGAAGFRIQSEKINDLKKSLDQYFTQIEPQPVKLLIEAWINPHKVGGDLLTVLEALKPFGVGNAEPVFGIEAVVIKEIKLLGDHQNHVRIEACYQQQPFTVMAFFADQFLPFLAPEKKFHLACKIKKEWFRGKQALKWHLVDMKPA